MFAIDIQLNGDWHTAGHLVEKAGSLAFEYDQNYVIESHQRFTSSAQRLAAAVHSTLPVHLMERYEGASLTGWLNDMGNVEDSLPGCDNQLGNQRWRHQMDSVADEEMQNPIGMTLDDVWDALHNPSPNSSLARYAHRNTSIDWLLGATDGYELFPTSAAFVEQTQLTPIMIPQLGLQPRSASRHETRKLQLGLVALNRFISDVFANRSAYDLPSHLPAELVLARPDVNDGEKSTLVAVDSLASLGFHYRNDSVLASDIIEFVSTNKLMKSGHFPVSTFLTQLLTHRLICNVLEVPFSSECVLLNRSEQGFSLIPPLVGSLKTRDYNDFEKCFVLDYAHLANELSMLLDPHELLYTLSEVADCLSALPGGLLARLGSDAETIIQRMGLHKVSHRLARQGLLL
ncbi:hypothetical protein [Alteromonas oceanisediminis]|uniref:hypothetical protein n=1 Tax=Alteromonas oceanisediminis TaxID=2836180 RepID=UPI001BDA3F2E|nr:hypothetical protein [Alteromonas oceanisediminis]MBT0587847.1 hypothetical protein [Alteromonas oceanisediminis]